MNSKITIGITGGIGSGKSMICRLIDTMGYPVFYSDTEAKRLLIEDSQLRDKVIQIFGEKAYDNTTLNRSFIAQQIFTNPAKKELLEGAVHPSVRKAFKQWSQTQATEFVFNEAAILFETGSYKNFHHTLLVCSPIELRIERIKKRDGISEEEIRHRINNQWSDEQKMKLADFVIQNNEKQLLIPQVIETLEKLKQLHENI